VRSNSEVAHLKGKTAEEIDTGHENGDCANAADHPREQRSLPGQRTAMIPFFGKRAEPDVWPLKICVRSDVGELLDERRCPTTALSGYLATRPMSRVVVETCSEAFAVADAALALGHELRVVPATLRSISACPRIDSSAATSNAGHRCR
jgi:hypothetical protein